MAGTSYDQETSRRGPRIVSVDVVYHTTTIPSQRAEMRATSTLELTGRDPAVPLSGPAQNATFPLKAHVDIPFHRGHPRGQETVPGDPRESRGPTCHQPRLHVVAKENTCINEPCRPQGWEEASALEPSSVAQSQMPTSRQREQSTWLDEQRSWLEWADISLPKDGTPPKEEFEGEANLDVALSAADQAVPDLVSEPYTDDLEPARWGSDPAFSSSKFVPKADQLSEREVTSIWEEYVATSLKPFANVLGSPIPPNQLLIVGNHNADLGFPEVESATGRIRWTPLVDTKRPKSVQSARGVDSSMPPPATVVRRGPLQPFRGGRKKPMPPRIRPFGSEYC